MLLTLLWALVAPLQDQSFDGAQDKSEAGAKAAVEALVDAVAKVDPVRFREGFHARRMMEELGAKGWPEELSTEEQRAEFVKKLELGLGRAPAQLRSMGMLWTGARVTRVNVAGGKPEAEVFAWVKTREEKSLYRFWVVKDGDAWKVYDFEEQAEGLRVSFIFSALLREAGDKKAFSRLAETAALLQGAVKKAAEGEIEAALGQLREASQRPLPAVFDGYLDMMEGGLLLTLGREEEALVVLDRALGKRQDLARAWQLKGEACHELERYEECIRAHGEFLKRVGDDPQACLQTGLSHKELGRREEAAAALRKGMAADDDEFRNRFELAKLLAEDGKPDEAKKLFLAAFEREGELDDLYAEASEALLAGDAPGVLLDLARDQAKRRGGDPDAALLLHEGHALRRLGKHDEAVKALRAGLAADADEEHGGSLKEELACALVHLGKLEEARELAGALGEEDEAASAYVQAYLAAAGGKEEDAVRDLKEALGKDHDLHAKVSREAVFEKVRKGAEIGELLRRSKLRSAFYEKAFANLFRERNGRLLDLAQAHTKALPDDMDGWYFMGTALRKLGRFAEAETSLSAGLKRASGPADRPKFWEELGYALARLGRPDEALAYARKLQVTEDWAADGYYVAAYAHAAAERTAEALKALGKALEADPSKADDVGKEGVFEELRRLPACKELLEKAREEKE